MSSAPPSSGSSAPAGCGASSRGEPVFGAGYEVLEPERLSSPLVFSSPHSGRIYPSSFLTRARLDPTQLRRSEDAFVDQLFADCLSVGAPMIKALFPRAYLDLNREPYELDPRMFDGRLPPGANTRSIRVAGGLGTIPRVVGQAQEIYRERLPVTEALQRIETLYRPYHARLAALLDRAELAFGCAVLIDCHSMPSGQAAPAHGGFFRRDEPSGERKADFVLGDRHGASCAPIFVETAEAELRSLGFTVARNKPYAGGYITEHYGAPGANRHALQIEIGRGLYMDEQAVAPLPRFAEIRSGLKRVAAALAMAAAARLPLCRDAAE
ncbi:N-formylglutamate amidohydrolase [Methylocella sp.]|uniref:N-formylglutamate amidohydrolase n=1 Tax=Methylocella sp. TaxID=1978226 RepID=UPI0037849F03